jgi:hypothetical protein
VVLEERLERKMMIKDKLNMVPYIVLERGRKNKRPPV